MEITTFYILKLRGGFYQGYPTFGAGVYLGPFRASVVWYTKEMGMYPGQLPESTLKASVAIRW